VYAFSTNAIDGFHLNILGVIAQLVLIRDQVMSSPSPGKLLRTLPDLESKAIIESIMKSKPLLSDSLYDQLVRHCYDPMIFEVICCE
jgi:cell cycle arrest protein BUB2